MAGNLLRAVLFDLDGTLVDSARDIAKAINQLKANRGGGAPVSVSRVRDLVSRGVGVLLAEALKDQCGDPVADAQEFRTLLRGLRADPEAIYPGVIPCLTSLSAAFELGIVTNKPEKLAQNLLEEVGLLRFFSIVVGGDTVGCEKPHKEPMQYALRGLQVAASEAVMVGDSHIDAAAAHATGMPFFLFARGYGASSCPEERVARSFHNFSSLPAMLRELTP